MHVCSRYIQLLSYAGGPELGRMLWESIGTMYSLLEFGKEDAVYKVMIKIPFPPLSGTYPTIQVVEYSSVYYDSYKQNLQCTCPDSDQIPVYFYPYLTIGSQVQQYDYLRLTGLGVIEALVK
nr:hypothetical protein [Tanacetum cinerariifolium]